MMANKVLEMAIAIKGQLDGSLYSSVTQAVSKTKELTKNISQANKELRKLQALEAKASGSERVKIAEEVAAKEAEINSTIAKRKSLMEAVESSNRAKDKYSNAKGDLGKTLKVTAVAAAPIALAIKAAMDFEDQMADVRKVVDFPTPEGFSEMQAQIIEMSQRLPMAASDIAKIVAAGGQSGIAAKDLGAFAESAVKMGIAFDITADQAGDMMAKWRTAFAMDQDKVVELADKINYLGNTTAASAPLISDVVTRIGPLGAVGGMASGEIAALGASMIGAGIQSEIAATGIKNLILGMTVGKGATDRQALAFSKLGLNAVDMAKKMQVDAKGAILQVMEALRGINKEEQATVLTDLFGKESIPAISPLLTNLEGLKDNLQKVGDATQYTGSMEAEYQARSQTTSNALQLAKNAVMALAINLGSVFLPAVSRVLGTLANAASAVASFAKEHQDAVTAVVAVAGAIAGLVIVVQSVQVVIAALNAVMALNPFVLIALAIIALIGVLVYLWNTNEAFRNALINAWEAIKAGISAAINAVVSVISAAFNIIVAVIQGAINFILNLPQNIAFAIGFIIGVITQLPTIVGNMIDATIAFLLNLPAAIVEIGSEFIAFMSSWLAEAYTTAVTQIYELVNGVYSFLVNLPSECAEAGAAFVAAAEQWASDAYNAVIEWVQQIPSAVSNAISGAWESIKSAFSGGFTVGVQAAGGGPNAYANGGIVNRPELAWIGEAGYPEVVVPIDGSQNAVNLWHTAGRMLGINNEVAPVMTGKLAPNIPSPESRGTQGDMNITFAPQITVHGNADTADIIAALEMKMREFEEMMRRYMNNQRRLSFD